MFLIKSLTSDLPKSHSDHITLYYFQKNINTVKNKKSNIEHEATVSKISEEKLFYLMSRGLTKDQATDLIVLGFTDEFKKELPMEYAVELNQLLKQNL